MFAIIIPHIFSIALGASSHITSRVVDSYGEPVSFAKVYTETSETYTDVNGYFELDVESDSLIVSAFSYSDTKICVEDCNGPIVIQDLKPKNIITVDK
jgi:hypothetical protein